VPGTLLASLFLYFGLRYTDEHYRQYGLDDTALGFSTTDYVVRSLNVTVQPARTVTLVAIGCVILHILLSLGLRSANHIQPGADKKISQGLALVLIGFGALGMFLFWSRAPLDVSEVTSTRWWLASVLLVMYGIYLEWMRPRPAGHPSRLFREALGDRGWRVAASLLLAFAILLVAHGAFDFTQAYAKARAEHQAMYNASHRSRFPLVTIYSKVDLALDDRLAVDEVLIPGGEGAYRYRYAGLRLFLQQNERLVMWPEDRSPRSGMFILRESDDIRIEYQPEPR
jgi:hypothetical protein